MVKLSFFSKTIKMTVCMVIMTVATTAAAQVENGQQPADEVELVVTGDGATKEQATLSALRSALEQAFGTFVSSNTQILNDDLVKDEIVSISTGNIKEYKYLAESKVDCKFYVTIKATVSVGKLIQYVKSKGGETELAGATFAMNLKMKRLQEENLKKAEQSFREQFELMARQANFFDYEIKVGEPISRGGNIAVPFAICGTINKNFSQLKEYQHTMPSVDVSDLIYDVNQCLKFKIVDNINEYYFTYSYNITKGYNGSTTTSNKPSLTDNYRGNGTDISVKSIDNTPTNMDRYKTAGGCCVDFYFPDSRSISFGDWLPKLIPSLDIENKLQRVLFKGPDNYGHNALFDSINVKDYNFLLSGILLYTESEIEKITSFKVFPFIDELEKIDPNTSKNKQDATIDVATMGAIKQRLKAQGFSDDQIDHLIKIGEIDKFINSK